MKKFFTVLITLILLMSGLVMTLFAEETHVATFVSHDDTKLTIYNNNAALIRETRSFELEAGLNEVMFTGVPTSVDLSTVMFRTLDDAESHIVRLYYRSAERPVLNNQMLLAENIGETITLRLSDERDITGTLLNFYGSELMIEQEDGSILSIQSNRVTDYRFNNLPDLTETEAALVLVVFSPEATEQQLEVSYLTGNINWLATHYNLALEDDDNVHISGWVTVMNQTGVDYEDAQITLASGQFNRVDFAARETGFAATQVAQVLPTSTPPATPTEITFGCPDGNCGGQPGISSGGRVEQPESLLFDLDGRMTLKHGEQLRIEFLGETETDASNLYVYDASPRVYGYQGFNTAPAYGQTEITHVLNFLEISTRAEGGASTDLLAGFMRIYRDTDNGNPALIGETTIAYTPEGETLRLFLDDSGDITGERRQTGFQTVSNDTVQESYDIRLSNRSDEAVTITIPERMTRSPRWEILGSSVPFEQPDPFSVEFEVDVPAGQDVVVSYTVLYTRPQ